MKTPKGKSQSKNKVSAQRSAYRLWIVFKEEFAIRRPHFSYYSNTRFSDAYELKQLKRRVLSGTCLNRYKLAMLFCQRTGQCLSVWLPGQAEMSFAQYEEFKKAQKTAKKSRLAALVIFKPEYLQACRAKGLRLPYYMFSSDTEPVTLRKGYDVSLRSILLPLREEAFLRGRFKQAIVYNQNTRQEVARINTQCRITFSDAGFEKSVLASSKFRVTEFGFFDPVKSPSSIH